MPLDDVPARPTAITNSADASIVKGMAARGDRQSDIAAWFGLNNGRINEVIKASTKHARQFRDVAPAPLHALPPPGPYSYFTPRPGASLADQLQQALASQDLKWAQGLATIREELRISAHERRQTNDKLDQLQRQLVTFARDVKLIEPPTTPKPTSRRPLAG
jgi:hypothetical protein